ncbi:MAG: type II secretion system F family protein [Desulfovibrio sp.]|nr:type II secretion system F family protein [Desulfovibrio sp.]MBI4958462.1 type II secretion system F family protein [Desulfovibrio sp.]
MTFFLGATLLILFWGLGYLWLVTLLPPDRQGWPLSLERYAARVSLSLDDMFLPVGLAKARTAILALAGAGALVGFILPSAADNFERLSIDQAVEFNRAGNYKAALSSLSRYKESTSALAHNELGVAYYGTGNMDQAEQEFQKALELKPQYAKAQSNLAIMRGLLGDPQRQAFEEARARQAEQLPMDLEELYPQSESLAGELTLRLFCAGIFALAFLQIPKGVLALIKRRRVKRFEAQLADGLVMASNGLRAGFSLLQALDLTASKSQAPLSQEFGLVLKEHRLGADLNEALRHLAQRMPTADTQIFVNSVSILRETGGNLTEIFDTLAETIQERKQIQTKIKTMTAEGETQAYFLAALPVVLGFILYQLNQESMTLFFTTFGGWLMLMLMGLMEVVGIAMMFKIVRVKV